jgi:hypothetical protein
MPENRNPILQGVGAAFMVFVRGSGIDRQRVLEALSEWKGNHKSSFAANIEAKIGRDPEGDVVLIWTRTKGGVDQRAMQADLDSTFRRRGIELVTKRTGH